MQIKRKMILPGCLAVLFILICCYLNVAFLTNRTASSVLHNDVDNTVEQTAGFELSSDRSVKAYSAEQSDYDQFAELLDLEGISETGESTYVQLEDER